MDKIKKGFILIMAVIVYLSSCSGLSKNMVKRGNVHIKGGVYQNLKWEDQLIFNRLSWYKELTLFFDAKLARIDEKSPFNNWFSPSERELLFECDDYYVVLTYMLDAKKISKGMFLDQFRKQGYQKLYISSFESHLRLHPDNEKLSLNVYDVFALCRKKGGEKAESTISFPGFNRVAIE